MSKKHSKPVGTTGLNFLGNLGPTTLSVFQSGSLTGDKAADEMAIVISFLKSAKHLGLRSSTPIIPVQNKESDFDFTLRTSSGEVILELLEIAPPEEMKAGYSNARATHEIHGFCESIFAQISKKSARYVPPARKRFDLLIYVAHWAFIPTQQCIQLLQYWCNTKQHIFHDIYLHLYTGTTIAPSFSLFPAEMVDLANFSPESLRGKQFTNFDPLNGKTGQGGNTSSGPIPLGVPGVLTMGMQIEQCPPPNQTLTKDPSNPKKS